MQKSAKSASKIWIAKDLDLKSSDSTFLSPYRGLDERPQASICKTAKKVSVQIRIRAEVSRFETLQMQKLYPQLKAECDLKLEKNRINF